jgi:hypothetical protein
VAGGDVTQDLAAARDESLTMSGLYETWVELDQRVKQAQNELQAILTTREEAAILRRRAQQRLDEGEDIRAEAQRISDTAWKAFERGFAVNAKGLPNRWTTVREIDEAMRTYTALQRATHSESWHEAERTRQRATTELLKALTSLNTALAHADRELKEATNLPSVADALKQSAQEELRCAQAIRNELLVLGQEALSELHAPQVIDYPGHQDVTISEPSEHPFALRPEPGPLGTIPQRAKTSQEELINQQPIESNSPSQSPSGISAGAGSVAWESPKPPPGQVHSDATFSPPNVDPPGEPSVVPDEVAAELREETHTVEPPLIPEMSPTAEQLINKMEISPPFTQFAQASAPATDPVADPVVVEEAPGSPPIDQFPATPETSEAAALEREIAEARPASESPGSAAAALAQQLAKDMAALGAAGEEAAPAISQPPPIEPAVIPEIIQPEVMPPTEAELLRREIEAATTPGARPEIIESVAAREIFLEEPTARPADEYPQPPRPEVIRPEVIQPDIVQPDIVQPDIVQPGEAELLRREFAAANAPSVTPDIGQPQTNIGGQDDPGVAGVHRPAPPAQVEVPSNLPAATYSGRIFLMFPSSLSQGRLESVWEILEQVAGNGNIADTRLVSRDAGIQFTLDMGDNELNIAELRSKIPDAEVVALDEDRLRIDWPS